MPPEIPGVRGFVVRALLESPDTSSKALYERAAKRYPDVGELSVQQFHGRYVLQVHRELKRRPPIRRPRFPDRGATSESSSDAPAEGAHARAASAVPEAEPAGTVDTAAAPSPAPRRSTLVEKASPPESRRPGADRRTATRNLFYRLALELEMAGSRRELVDVISGIDRYVDEAMELAGP